MELAQDEVDKGNIGQFISEEKGFYERVKEKHTSQNK